MFLLGVRLYNIISEIPHFPSELPLSISSLNGGGGWSILFFPSAAHTSNVCCIEHSDWVAVAFVILGSSPSRNHITTLSSWRAGIATKNKIHYNNIQETKPENPCQRPPSYLILVPYSIFQKLKQSGMLQCIVYVRCYKVCIISLDLEMLQILSLKALWKVIDVFPQD